MPKRPARKPLVAALALLALGLFAFACKGEGYSGEPEGIIAFAAFRTLNPDVFFMNADGSDQRNVTNSELTGDREPSFSPDGAMMAFSSSRGDTGVNIWVMDLATGEWRQLTDNAAIDGGARWSPEGDRLAFYSFRDQDAQLLWIMNADGANPTPILADLVPSENTPCLGGFPGNWYPDSDRLVFRGSQGSTRNLQICSVNTDGTGGQTILNEPGTLNYHPAVSPDGNKIAFTSNRDGNFEIYVMNANGGGLKRLTEDDATDEYPVWSPDGQWLAFHSNRSGNFDIFIMRPDGSDVRQLTDDEADDMEPFWGTDDVLIPPAEAAE
jgi:Tol biopolymer transport system component